jgi:hypothetical protein
VIAAIQLVFAAFGEKIVGGKIQQVERARK